MSCVRVLPSARACVQPRRCTQAAAKKDLHPVLHTAKIICNGEDVGEITGTKEEYVVDVWAGNHPFYRGDGRSLVIDEGQVNKFKSRYAALGAMSNIKTLSDSAKEDKDARDAKAAK